MIANTRLQQKREVLNAAVDMVGTGATSHRISTVLQESYRVSKSEADSIVKRVYELYEYDGKWA